MAELTESNPPLKSDLQVSMPDVVKFVRQLSHDLRNDLNAAELQSAYLAEIAEDPETKDEIKRLRTLVAEVGLHLQKVTAALGSAKLALISYDAGDFLEDLRLKLATAFPDHAAKVEWKAAPGKATLEIDPQSLLPALMELFENAFRHEPGDGAISAEARTQDEGFILTLREPKRGFAHSTENWGREPFRTVSHGHYGLGLHRTRAIVEGHGGQFTAHYDPATCTFITTVVLPTAQAN